jgi:hypothetical protein
VNVAPRIIRGAAIWRLAPFEPGPLPTAPTGAEGPADVADDEADVDEPLASDSGATTNVVPEAVEEVLEAVAEAPDDDEAPRQLASLLPVTVITPLQASLSLLSTKDNWIEVPAGTAAVTFNELPQLLEP